MKGRLMVWSFSSCVVTLEMWGTLGTQNQGGGGAVEL